MQIPQNLGDVYQLYIAHLNQTYSEKTSRNKALEIGYTFRVCLSVGLGYPKFNSMTKITNVQRVSIDNFLTTQSLDNLPHLRLILKESFKQVKRSEKMYKIYQRSLEQFLSWCSGQVWWPGKKPDCYSPNDARLCCPVLISSHSSQSRQKLTHHQGLPLQYCLPDRLISNSLQMELYEFLRFLTQPEYIHRVQAPISLACAQRYLKDVLLILGWFYNYEGVQPNQLSLSCLIPRVDLNAFKTLSRRQQDQTWLAQQQQILGWLKRYLYFLEEVMDSFSPRTKTGKLSALSALSKFIYCDWVEVNTDYQAIPIFQVISTQLRDACQQVKDWNRKKRYVGDVSLKWPDPTQGKTVLKTVIDTILEPLRLSCLPKSRINKFRSRLTIAKSEQLFLAWYLLAGLPARRQEEYRSLKLALSCPIQRPPLPHLPADGVYHPLPPVHAREQRQNGTLADNFLYKAYVHLGTFYPDGLWVMDIQVYKTVTVYGPQSIVIPNRQFGDGSWLYEHFDRYLYGWWLPGGRQRQMIYDWWQADLWGRRGRWVCGGRSEFEPYEYCALRRDLAADYWTWGYFFVRPLTHTAYSASRFAAWIQDSAFHHSGKQISPHLMRSVWATWAFECGLTVQQQESLAYAMGHSLQMMKTLYERSSPQQKRKPIETTIENLLFQSDLIPPEHQRFKLLQETIQTLSPEQNKQLAHLIQQKMGMTSE